MANYSNLKNIIDQVVRTNGQGDITGANLNQTLQQMVTDLGANYQYAGVATPSTNPGSPDQNVFYIATLAGTYSFFNGIVLPKGITVLRWNGSWSSTTLYTIDTGLTPESEALVQSGTVFEKFKFDGGPWNVSAHFPAGGPNSDGKFSLEYILSNANTYIPTNIRIGGMSIRFVQSSDNKYVQCRLMLSTFTAAQFANVANWQVVDDKPTSNSNNLVKSGGIYNAVEDVKLCIGDELDKTIQQGLLKWDGTIDTTTLPNAKFASIAIPNGATKIYISMPYMLLNAYYAYFWILDANHNILFKERGGQTITYVYRELALPQDAAYIYIAKGETSTAYSTKELYPTIKNLEINSEQAQQDITNLAEQTDSISETCDSLEKSLFESVKIDESSSIFGFLKTNGTIASGGGTIFKFDIVEGIAKYYVTLHSGITPNVGWSQYWLVDNNGTMLAQKPVTIPSPQNYNGDLEIDISTVAGVTQIWLSASPDYPHYLTYSSQNIIDVNKLKSDVEQAQQDIEGIQEQIADIGENRNQWRNKKIVWMGTSIPAGQGISGRNYPTQIAELLSCTVQNNAVPGLALEGILNEGVWTPKSGGSASLTLAEYAAAGVMSPGNKCYENNMLGKNADLYVFDCEPNNSNADTTILNNFNVNTWTYIGEFAGTTLADHRDCYVGCLLYLLDKLWTEKPDAKVVFVGEHTSCTDFARDYAMSAASAALAQKLRIPYIDLADRLYYNIFNVSIYVNGDKVHPTQAGHDRIAKILANELMLIA